MLLALAVAACSDSPGPTDVADPPVPQSAKGGQKGGKGGGEGRDPGTDGAGEEDFSVWDATRWTRGDHELGLGYLAPENVSVSGGALSISLPANTYDGGEIRSVERFRSGTFQASLKAAAAPGSLTAFFLYEYSELHIDEIDIEVIPDYLGRGPHVMFTTWVSDIQTNHVVQPLSFDPAAGFHTYEIEFSRKEVRFHIDGELRQEFTRDLPRARMHLMVNAWWPWWLYGSEDHSDAAARVDWIRY